MCKSDVLEISVIRHRLCNFSMVGNNGDYNMPKALFCIEYLLIHCEFEICFADLGELAGNYRGKSILKIAQI